MPALSEPEKPQAAGSVAPFSDSPGQPNWRPELSILRAWLVDCASDLNRLRAVVATRRFPPRGRDPWAKRLPSENEHHPVLGRLERPFAVRVSVDAHLRALQVLNAITTEAVNAGFRVEADLARVRFIADGEMVSAVIHELSKAAVAASDSTSPLQSLDNEPSGRLRIRVFESLTSSVNFDDQPKHPLENQIADVLATIAGSIRKR